jgi:hypothetical protein
MDDDRFKDRFRIVTNDQVLNEADVERRIVERRSLDRVGDRAGEKTGLHVVDPVAVTPEDSAHSVTEWPLNAEVVGLRAQLAIMRQEHQDLNDAIHALEHVPMPDQILIMRLKRKKLALKDRIASIEDKIMPDIIA